MYSRFVLALPRGHSSVEVLISAHGLDGRLELDFSMTRVVLISSAIACPIP